METLIFSQRAIFRIQQLANCMYHKTGVRYRMATQEGMISLLKEAGASHDKDVRHSYDAFVMELNKRQLEMLEERNVNIRPIYTHSSVSHIRKAG